MQLTNFYTILSSEQIAATTWDIHVRLNPEQIIYQGHFPQQPVVPGVCLLHIIKECAENIRGQKLQFAQIGSCKFLSSLNPSDAPEVSFLLTFKEAEEGRVQLQAEGILAKKEEEECFIKLKAVLAPRP